MSSHLALEYAPGAPVRRRKRNRRIGLFLLVLGIGLAAWQWGPGMRDHAVLLYWQRQCMNYEIPKDVVLWEQDPAKARVLLGQPNPDYVPIMASLQNRGLVTQAIYVPHCLREFQSRIFSGSGLSMGDQIIYLHERYTPSGKRRLVVVAAPVGDAGALWAWQLYDPGAMFKPKLLNTGLDEEGLRTGALSGWYIPKHLGACQNDPADASHFTLPCFVNGHLIGVYDGRLTDDDKIVITKPKK